MSIKKSILILLVVFILIVIGYFTLIKTIKINPITKAINPSAYGLLCGEIVDICDDLIAINCGAEVDGPFYYVDGNSGEIVGECGGCLLFGGCQGECPPKEWTCK